MRRLDVARRAIVDFEEISAVSLTQFGQHQTSKYLESFDRLFDRLLETPGLGRPTVAARGAYRVRNGGHFIYFE